MPFFYFCAPLSFSRLVHSHKKERPRLGQFSSRLIHLLIYPFSFPLNNWISKGCWVTLIEGGNFIWDTVSFDELCRADLKPKLSNSTFLRPYWNIMQQRNHFALVDSKNWKYNLWSFVFGSTDRKKTGCAMLCHSINRESFWGSFLSMHRCLR